MRTLKRVCRAAGRAEAYAPQNAVEAGDRLRAISRIAWTHSVNVDLAGKPQEDEHFYA